jgi:hypothetical protein
MARKRDISAVFEDVVDTNENKNNDNNENKNNNQNENKNDVVVNNENNNNIDSNDNINRESDDDMENTIENKSVVNFDFIDNIGKKKEKKKVFTGIYLDEDVAKSLDKLAKKGGKGAKSEIVNDTLKIILQQKGLL